MTASSLAVPTPAVRARSANAAVATHAVDDERLASVPDRIAAAIRATADHSRRDRLWPAHFQVFLTNPLSVAYGACGPALYLARRGGVGEETIAWLASQRLSVDTYAPSLFAGLAGIAVSFMELGLESAAHDAMALVYASPLKFADPSMLHGVAGWGWASLYFYDVSGDERYLNEGAAAARWILSQAIASNHTLAWAGKNGGPTSLGYAHGASGIGLFLLELWQRSGDATFLDGARRAIAFDLSGATATGDGQAWGRFVGDSLVEPYWLHGTSGVGTAVARFARVLGDERYVDAATAMAHSASLKFTIVPGQFEGMSGVGEFLLDAAELTGDRAFRGAAEDLAHTILWYAVERYGGVMFPGSFLGRLSNDYATGSAGVGFFFDRLLSGGPRRFIDLPAGR